MSKNCNFYSSHVSRQNVKEIVQECFTKHNWVQIFMNSHYIFLYFSDFTGSLVDQILLLDILWSIRTQIIRMRLQNVHVSKVWRKEKKIVILEKKITVVRYLKFADERKSSRKISECPVFQTSFFSEAITQYEKTYLLTDKLTKKGLSYLPSHSHTKNIFVRNRSRFFVRLGHKTT